MISLSCALGPVFARSSAWCPARLCCETGTSERKTGQQVGGANVELSLLTENLHDLVRVNAQRLGKVADLIDKPDFERMPTIVDVRDHLGRLQVRSDQRHVELGSS
jgi:hypothetical protein